MTAHRAPRALPASPTYPLTAALDAEWRRLRGDPEALRRARTWQVVEGSFDSLDAVLTAIGFGVAPTPAAERNLRCLVDHARHDRLAAEVVVRRLLPGALSVAGRRRRSGCADAVEELLGALWIAVRTFDPGRRPACLAAALLADADYRAFRAGWRRRLRGEVPCERLAEHPAAEPSGDPAAELAELIEHAAATGVAGRDDVELLHRLVAEPSPSRLAHQLQVTERTVRNRRDRLTAKLRQVADDLTAA